MEIEEVASGVRRTVVISEAGEKDYKKLTRKRFSFPWKEFRGLNAVSKLQIEGEDDILGAILLEHFPEEKRFEIELLASSAENIGQGKRFSGIAGCLIANACRQAVARYGLDACVSLIPKTVLAEHYVRKYHMKYAGRQLYIDGSNLINLIKEYDEI